MIANLPTILLTIIPYNLSQTQKQGYSFLPPFYLSPFAALREPNETGDVPTYRWAN